MKRAIATLLALFLLVGLLRSMGAEKDAAEVPAAASAHPELAPARPVAGLPPASPPNRHFALADIAQAYKKDAAAADKRFKSRRFGVSGQVESVQPDYLGLFVENVARVRAELDTKGISDARAIKAGRSVVLSCIGNGTGFYAVELVGCHVVTGTTLIPRDKPPVFSPSPGLPDYPTALKCIEATQRGNWIGSAANWQAACISGEAQDKSWLVNRWRGFDSKTRENCLVNEGEKQSYTYLKTCLEVGGI